MMRQLLTGSFLLLIVLTVSACGGDGGSDKASVDQSVDGVVIESLPPEVQSVLLSEQSGVDVGSIRGMVADDESSTAPTGDEWVLLRGAGTNFENVVGRIWQRGSTTSEYRVYGEPLSSSGIELDVKTFSDEPEVRSVIEWEAEAEAALLDFVKVDLAVGERASTTLTRAVEVEVKNLSSLTDEIKKRRQAIPDEKKRILHRLGVLESLTCWVLVVEHHKSFEGKADFDVPVILSARGGGFKKTGEVTKRYLYTARFNSLENFH